MKFVKLVSTTSILIASMNASLGWAGGGIQTRTVDISTNDIVSRINVQVPIYLSASNFSYANAAPDGSDLRFFLTGSNCFGNTFIPHFVDVWNPSGVSVVWVLVPQLPAAETVRLNMRYGATTPVGGSSFAAVFPDAYVESRPFTVGDPNTYPTLTGTLNHSSFAIPSGQAARIAPSAPLRINARRLVIDGELYGVGSGHAGGPAVSGGARGSGPGGGTPASPMNAGSGGGSHAGMGGSGGFDVGDSPGMGGPTYGSDAFAASDAELMGSGGGGSDLAFGGAGGGGFHGASILTRIGSTAVVNMNGASGAPGSARGGGGGSGGSVEFAAERFFNAGTISVNGGGGSIGVSSANDDGGGGGGGRIKIKAIVISDSGTLQANGGPGGPNGTSGPGASGSGGSVSLATATATQVVYDTRIGAEQACVVPDAVFQNGFEGS